jgi:hypothetical protein
LNSANTGSAECETTADAHGDQASEERTIAEELKLLLKQFHELSEYVEYYAAAKADSSKLSLRHFVASALLSALGLLAVGGLIFIASWLLSSGVAEFLGTLLGNRAWAGNIATGLLLVAGLVCGVYYFVAKWNKSAHERTARKYETRQARQRTQFGHDVADRAAAASRK